MSIFAKITLQSLKKNRTRTIVTIIGVILSAAMFTGVMTFVSSFQHYMLETVIATDGDWHGYYMDVDSHFLTQLSEDQDVDHYAVSENLGYAAMPEENADYKPYMFVTAFSTEAYNTIPITLHEGRLPENEHEIMIPDIMESNGNITYKIGDTLTLPLGERTYDDGDILNQYNPLHTNEDGESIETLIPGPEKTYTIVGIINQPTYENYSAPGYTLYTYLDTQTISAGKSYDVFINLVHPKDIYDFTQTTAADYGSTLNRDLLRYMGISNDDNFNAVLYGLAAILMALIMGGSILLIYNSFSISVSERTRQFGILSSIGATRKQLQWSVLYEGLFIAVIGLPIGIIAGITGIGITLALTGDKFHMLSSADIPMSLWVSPGAIAIAALISLAAILISAYIPARKAARLSAMDAIRQSTDIKVTAKDIKTTRPIQALFGLEGMLATKNFKRNKKGYRSTVISLFVSIVLFISASAFGLYLKQGMVSTMNNTGYDLTFSYYGASQSEALTLYNELSDAPGITGGGYVQVYDYAVNLPAHTVTDRYITYTQSEPENGMIKTYVALYFIDDNSYQSYLKQLKLDSTVYTGDPLHMITLNTMEGYDFDSGRFVNFEAFNAQNLEGLVLTLTPADYALTENDAGIDSANTLDITIAHLTENMPDLVSQSGNSQITFFVPYSMKDAYVFPDQTEQNLGMNFFSSDPTKSAEAIQDIMKEKGIFSGYYVYNKAQEFEYQRSMLLIVNVFTYGFTVLITLIAMANVFNTISTNISLRRRELAMLQSVGMTRRGFHKMMNFECIFYGLKALVFGLPTSFLITWLIYNQVMRGTDVTFTLPWAAIGISVIGVFTAVFATMMYSIHKINKQNTIDSLKNE